MKMKILNSKGLPIVLNAREERVAQINQRHCNALGYEIDITTLTTIMKKITEQKFFEIAPADYLPVRVGEGAWSQQLTTYRSFALGGDFETGNLNTGANNSRLAGADAGIDSVSIKVINWAKAMGWSLFDLEFASKSGNWDLVTAKEHARKKNWDLGIQKIAFLGSASDTSVKGLLTQSGVTTNTTFLTSPLSGLSPGALKDFCVGILTQYRNNCARTAWPTHFAIPESDYLGLNAPSSAEFPVKTTLQILEESFGIMTGKKFKILPLSYADTAYSSGATVQKYTLYNYEEESLRMDIPVDYTNTLANSLDNFSFQNVGYGQYTGALVYRPDELMYFTFTP